MHAQHRACAAASGCGVLLTLQLGNISTCRQSIAVQALNSIIKIYLRVGGVGCRVWCGW